MTREEFNNINWVAEEEENVVMRGYVKARKEYTPQLERELREWKESIPDTEETKKQVLLEKLARSKYFPEEYDMKKLERDARHYLGHEDQITYIDIERAKDYSIRDILHVQKPKGNISCPFHDDKNPSFSIKNNRFKCFSCQESGDSIALYQKINDCSFKEAVKALS